MRDTGPGAGETRWPHTLDPKDPEGFAEFCLMLGYAEDVTVNSLMQRCKLDMLTAREVVQRTKTQLQEGGRL